MAHVLNRGIQRIIVSMTHELVAHFEIQKPAHRDNVPLLLIKIHSLSSETAHVCHAQKFKNQAGTYPSKAPVRYQLGTRATPTRTTTQVFELRNDSFPHSCMTPKVQQSKS